MKRTSLIIGITIMILLHGLLIEASSSPFKGKSVLLKGFWFADGFLTDDPRYMDWVVIPNQEIILYESPSLTSSIVTSLAAGSQARLQDIAFEAYPDYLRIKAIVPAISNNGKIAIERGDAIGLICYMGDAMAAYVGNQLVLLDIQMFKVHEQVRPEWRSRLLGANQWLQIFTEEGKTGWARFYNDNQNYSRGRWQTHPQAVGGTSNFNTIIFSSRRPSFEQPTQLTFR